MPNKKQSAILKITPHPTFVEHIHSEILKNGSLKIVGLGIFKLHRMPAVKKGFNPFNGKIQTFAAYTKISFSPTKKLKEKIQKWK